VWQSLIPVMKVCTSHLPHVLVVHCCMRRHPCSVTQSTMVISLSSLCSAAWASLGSPGQMMAGAGGISKASLILHLIVKVVVSRDLS
jgi:hypothetical protein